MPCIDVSEQFFYNSGCFYLSSMQKLFLPINFPSFHFPWLHFQNSSVWAVSLCVIKEYLSVCVYENNLEIIVVLGLKINNISVLAPEMSLFCFLCFFLLLTLRGQSDFRFVHDLCTSQFYVLPLSHKAGESVKDKTLKVLQKDFIRKTPCKSKQYQGFGLLLLSSSHCRLH